MVRIAFIVYRQWGYEIFKNILEFQKEKRNFDLNVLITLPNPEFYLDIDLKNKVRCYEVESNDEEKLYEILIENKISIVCLYSWSFIVGTKLLDNFICLCLHPSLLPKYRGGTPIQNQLIRGVKKSGITIFKMNEEIDAGDIYAQAKISFSGDVHDIFHRMISEGTGLTKKLIDDAINGTLKFVPQKNLKKSLVYKRLKPSQSEIMLDQLSTLTFEQLNNKVRGLLDPYPNAFIKLDNLRMSILKIRKSNKLPRKNYFILNSEVRNLDDFKNQKVYLKLKDSFAQIVESSNSEE